MAWGNVAREEKMREACEIRLDFVRCFLGNIVLLTAVQMSQSVNKIEAFVYANSPSALFAKLL